MLLILEDRSIRGDGSDGLFAPDPGTRPRTLSGPTASTGVGFYHTAGGDGNDWGRDLRPERSLIQMIRAPTLCFCYKPFINSSLRIPYENQIRIGMTT